MELIRIIFKDGASNGNILHGKNKSLRIEWFDNLLLHKLDLINPLRADRTRKAGLNIDNNYCHNAFGQDVQPWCYFESSGTSNPHVHEWGYCDIPTCDQFCDNSGTTISSTAYMTSTVSTKPARHPSKRRDPFVTCWNKCYQTGPLNGAKCMSNCMRVSKNYFFRKFPIFLRIKSLGIKSNLKFRYPSNQSVNYFSRRFVFAIQGEVNKKHP